MYFSTGEEKHSVFPCPATLETNHAAENAAPAPRLYRFEDVVYAAPLDAFDNPLGEGTLKVELRTYRIRKTTPCGAWLDIGRFVKNSGRKRFAWPTEAEALASFMARKQRQLGILKAQVSRVERAMAMIVHRATQEKKISP